MWFLHALRGLGITTKLIVPFIAIFGLAVAGLGMIFVERQGGALSDALAKKAEILARNLATALGEPFAAGDAGLAQQLLDAAKRSDEDTVYAIALRPDGRVLASTDGSLRNQTLARTELEAGALRASDFLRQGTSDPDVFEVAMPISRQGARLGVLRIGVSTHQLQTLARKGAWSVAVVALIGLGVGGAVYFYVARLVARPLREVVTRLDQLAAGDADLTLRLEVRSLDEVGHLCRALNTFLDNLHRLVGQIRATAYQVGGRPGSSPRPRRSSPAAPRSRHRRWSRPRLPWRRSRGRSSRPRTMPGRPASWRWDLGKPPRRAGRWSRRR